MEIYLAHIGVNPENSEELNSMISLLGLLFPEDSGSENPLSYFMANGKMELMKEKGYGDKGHLAFYTSDIYRTIGMMEEKGYHFDQKSAKYNEDGSLRLIYIDKQVNGFAIHLTTRK